MTVETLASEKNPLFKQVRRAVWRGELTADGCAVAEGFHLLEEALASGLQVETAIVSEEALQAVERKLPRLAATRLVATTPAVFAGLAATASPQGVLALVRPRTWSLEDVFRGRALAVALDGVQDPGNAGAVARSAEAFGATGVVFLKGSVNPYHPRCLRGSAGSLLRMPLAAAVEQDALVAAADAAGARLFAAMPRGGLPCERADFTAPCAILIGGEGPGVRPTLASRATAVCIPVSGVESLNAAVACGVLIYEARRQRSRA
jgi:TrmH family RNA methyltransferase